MDGILVPDVRRRHPGRGSWIHPDRECLRNADRRRAFPRALRVPGPLDATGVFDYLERQLSVMSGPESRSTRHESAVKLKP
ncbi:MAG: YlxR family protein [Sciscionella sp.]